MNITFIYIYFYICASLKGARSFSILIPHRTRLPRRFHMPETFDRLSSSSMGLPPSNKSVRVTSLGIIILLLPTALSLSLSLSSPFPVRECKLRPKQDPNSMRTICGLFFFCLTPLRPCVLLLLLLY